MKRPDVAKRFEDVLNKGYKAFLSTVLNMVANDKKLQGCTPESVFSAAMTAAVLNLDANPNLGQAYIIPYGKEAQFQVGYKGFKQLAIRSGQMRRIGASVVREGQIVDFDPLGGHEFNFNLAQDAEVIGYVSRIVLLNGFEHDFYMTVEDMKAHAREYSQGYKLDLKKGWTTSSWTKTFEKMALKTVLKLNLNQNAPLSTEMKMAVTHDQSVINEDLSVKEYSDNSNEVVIKEELNPSHEKWEVFKEGIKSGDTEYSTIEAIYDISEENRDSLLN
jgi:recombination protein RecT